MRDVKMAKYQKKFDYSFSFGVFPTLELVRRQSQAVVKVMVSGRAGRNEGVKEIEEICKRRGISFVKHDNWIRSVGADENVLCVGVFMKYQFELTEATHLVLVSPEDMGNMGANLRTALAFGIRDVAIIRPAVDVWDPKAIRSSMGAVFGLRVSYFASLEEYCKKYQRKMYLFVTNGRKSVREMGHEKGVSLVFGSESAGLGREIERMGDLISIPYSPDVDSLNLSVAVGIGLYEYAQG